MRSSDGGLAAIAYAPCVIDTTIGGTSLHVEVTADSTYPFGVAQQSRIMIKVQPAAKSRFPLHLRIPSWADAVSCGSAGSATAIERVNDLKPGSFLKLDREWEANFTDGSQPDGPNCPCGCGKVSTLRSRFSADRSSMRSRSAPSGSYSKTGRACRLTTGRYFPKSPWNYALEIDREHPARGRSHLSRASPAALCSPRSGAPLVAKVKGRRLRDWKLEKGAAAAPPRSPARSLGAARGAPARALRVHRLESE